MGGIGFVYEEQHLFEAEAPPWIRAVFWVL
jgi:hypothetical protein